MAQEEQVREELLIRDRVTGQPRPYYVAAENINLGDDEEYESLPDRLNDMQDEIDAAGSGNGTVNGVKMNGTTNEPDKETGIVDLGTVITSHQSLAALFGKVAYNSSTHRINFYGKDDTLMETVLGYIDCSAFIVDGMLSNVEVKNVTISGTSTLCMVFSFNTDAGKQDINVPVSSIFNAALYYTKTQADTTFQLKLVSGTNIKTVNNTSLLGEGNISIPAGQDGKSAYDIAVEEGFVGTETEWLASLKGAKGDQGDTVVLDTEGLPLFKVVNDLTTGGGEDALSAEQGKRLRLKLTELEANFQDLLSKLAGIAFTGEKPSYPEIDWSLPKYTVSVDTTNAANASVEGSWPKQVTQGDAAVITVAPNTGYQLSAVSYKIGASGESQTASISDGKAVITIEHVTESITVYITASAGPAHAVNVVVKKITAIAYNTSAYNVLKNPSGASQEPYFRSETATDTGCGVSGAAPVADGGTYNGAVQMGSGYGLYKMVVKVGSTDKTSTAVDKVAKTIELSNVDDDVTIELYVRETVNGLFSGTSYNMRRSSSERVGGDLVITEGWCCLPDVVKIPNGATKIKWYFGGEAGAIIASQEAVLNKCCPCVQGNYSGNGGYSRGSDAAVTFRELNAADYSTGLMRVSFIEASSGVTTGRLEYSIDGTNFLELWPNFVEPNNE